jgi:Arc/MetJ family transcription regulator|uniref:type II toxin-antitoxin system VapB family antitoxin n=1 Tax=Sphingomonas sp. TaxID=28214 RepID=UPI0026000FDD|nr:type II toxin-antitoxin system VapB family antitoxin [Sphingomonas sp.]
MRTNIVIDDALMAEAQAALGVKTKREAVEEALRRVVQLKRQQGLLALRGIGWEGDLDAMRTD